MSTRSQIVRHLFAGGWATARGPTSSIEGRPVVQIPFLIDAENVTYELDGGPHKSPGTSKLNSAALESGAVIKGLFDAWFSGTGGTSTQHRIVHVGTTIKKDDADGTFTNLFTGLEAGKIPSYSMLEDVLVMTSDSTADVPKSWDGTTAQDLAGTPPNFAFAETHKNRMWAAGDAALPSRLYFTVLLDPEDWVGSGSGSIDIEPDDGDRITAIASHKNELWVFKGPHKGSIHRITGSAPTGSDAFARTTFVKGLGAVAHNTIFRFRDDLGFMWSDASIHSLNATAAFGDFNEAALSRDIQNWMNENVNFTRLGHAWAANWSEAGYVLFTLATGGNSDNNVILMMDYRFNPVRWAKWPAYEAGSVAQVVDSADASRQILMGGFNDGFVRKLNQSTRSIDGDTAIGMIVTTPFLNYGSAWFMKTLEALAVGLAPKNDGSITFGWTRDNNAQQTTSISQGGGDVLGPADANEFTLGTSTLSGSRFVDRFDQPEEGGEFRSIQYQITHSTNNEDVELHSISASISGATESWEND